MRDERRDSPILLRRIGTVPDGLEEKRVRDARRKNVEIRSRNVVESARSVLRRGRRKGEKKNVSGVPFVSPVYRLPKNWQSINP